MRAQTRVLKFRLRRGRRHQPKPPPYPLSESEANMLGRYNAEKARGLDHNWVWENRMKSLQLKHNQWEQRYAEMCNGSHRTPHK